MSDFRHRLSATFRWLNPGPGSTHLLTDRSGWWRDPEVLAGIGPALAALASGEPTVVAAPAASGFLIGPLVAQHLGVGFVEAYRGLTDAELADRLLTRFTVPGHDGLSVPLSIRAKHLGPGDRVLIVDDWAETGAQLGALAALCADAGATYVGAVVLVDGLPDAVRDALRVRGVLTPADLPKRR
jgi:adenine phosphoribosyltransferase